MVQRVDGVDAELQAALAAHLEVLLQGQVEELLGRPPRLVQRAWGVAELALLRPHEGGGVEVGLALLAHRAVVAPQRIAQRHAGHEVRTDGAHVAEHAEPVVVAQDDHQGHARLDPARPAEAPAAQEGLPEARRAGEEPAVAPEGQVGQEGGAQVVLDVVGRDRPVRGERRAQRRVAIGPNRVEVGEAHAAAVGGVVAAVAERVVERVGERAPVVAQAHGQGVVAAVRRGVQHAAQPLVAEIGRAQVGLREADDAPIRIAAAERIVDLLQRVQALAEVGLAQREGDGVDVHRGQEQMRAFAAEVRDLQDRPEGELVGDRRAPALEVRDPRAG